MKRFALLLALAVSLALPAHATIKQVTTVSASASTIVTPGNNIHTLVIQNNGSGDVRLSLDGSTAPTASTGYLLKTTTYIIFTYGGSKAPPVVKAILVNGTTTTLDIITDDLGSS